MALLGPSGSGKTTILRLIAGLERPDQGRIFLEEEDVCSSGHCLPPEKRAIGMVFQDYALFPHLTVAGNIAFGVRRKSQSEKIRFIDTIVEMVGLSSFRERYPHELSGGQQQRVALARALAPDPVVILLDEPFSNLDPDMRTQMRSDVTEILQKAGRTAVLVTHDHEEAFAMADRIALLNDGRLEQIGTPEAVYHTPVTPFVADFVGHADFISGVVQKDIIETVIGNLQNNSKFPSGTEVVVMIRPDDIDLISKEMGNATIWNRQFRGSENLYTVRLSSGEIIHSSLHSLAVYPNQTKVNIRLKLTHTVVFEKSEIDRELLKGTSE
ncbi:ABC transporter ATP-binding protein [Nitrospira defluvii]|nr:ABC transporter ATP-binding protein [Nitrospira defluvii]